MNDRQALLQAVLDDPDDDLVRLVFADWLQENGEEDFAEYIRLGVELAGFTPPMIEEGIEPMIAFSREDGERWCRVRSELLRMEPGIAAVRCEVVELPEVVRRRGFVESVRTTPAEWLAHGDRLMSLEPVVSLHLELGGISEADTLASLRMGCNSRLQGIRIESGLSEAMIEVLEDESVWPRLVRLRPGNVGVELLERLLMGSILPRLEEFPTLSTGSLERVLNRAPETAFDRISGGRLKAFHLDGVYLNPGVFHSAIEGRLVVETERLLWQSQELDGGVVRMLAESEQATSLDYLGLSGPDLELEDLRAVLTSIHLPRLRTLALGTVRSSSIPEPLPSEIPLRSLCHLYLEYVSADDAGLEWLFAETRWPQLKSLFLNGEDGIFGGKGLSAVCGSQGLAEQLVELRCKGLHPVDGTIEILAKISWRALWKLSLEDADLSDEGFGPVADSPNFAGLRSLDLRSTRLTDEGIRRVVESPYLQQLRELNLSCVETDAAELASLLEAGCLPHLCLLDLHRFHPYTAIDQSTLDRLRQRPGLFIRT